MTDAEHRLQSVTQRIEDACVRHGRKPESVELIAVSKTHPAAKLRELYEAGQRIFAENYVQEGVDKVHSLQALDINWHFIGHIQSNKSHDVARCFDWVHSIDRLKIARRLSQSEQRSRDINVLIQVNIDREASKSGILPEELPALCDQIAELDGLVLRGLMAIPRAESQFDRQRPGFARLRELLESVQAEHTQMNCLSMGMSNDLEAAIAEGATHVRIGTALFGPRQ